MGLFPWLANWNVSGLREFLSSLDALPLSTVPSPNTAYSPELFALVLLFVLFCFFWWNVTLIILKGNCIKKQIEVLTDEIGLSHLGVLFITNVLAKGWLLNLDPLPKGTPQDPWEMVKSGKTLLQILPVMEKCPVLQHRKGCKEMLLEVFASLLYSLLSSWSNKLS